MALDAVTLRNRERLDRGPGARVSVIVVTYRRRGLVERCLQSVEQARQRLSVQSELIVVDNGSADGTAELVRRAFPHARLVQIARNEGFTRALDTAVTTARGEWIALFNDDTVLERDALEALHRAGQRSPEIGGVTAQLRFASRPDTINSAGLEIDDLGIASDRLVGLPVSDSELEETEVFGVSGGAALYRREMLDDVGGFDGSFFAYLEDADVAWRARMRGWRMMYAPSAVVYHDHSATLTHWSDQKFFLVGRNRIRLLAKNADRRQLLRHGPMMIAYDLCYVLFALVRYRTLAPLRGRFVGIREWRRYRRAGSGTRSRTGLARRKGFRAALQRNRVWGSVNSAASPESGRRRGPRRIGAVADALVARLPLSPLIVFPAVWIIGVSLAQIKVFSLQHAWSERAWFVMALVPVAFVIGGAVGRAGVHRLTSPAPPRVPTPEGRRQVRYLLVVALIFGYAELAHQFVAAGAVPALAANIDAARATQPGGPTIVLTDLLTVAAIVALTLPRRLLSRDSIFELAVAALGLIGYALMGGRLLIVLVILSVLFARWLLWGPPRALALVSTSAFAVFAISGVYYWRASQHQSNAFELELFESVLPQTPVLLWPLIPIHMGIVLNFETLSRVVSYFPVEQEFGHGAYNALGLDLFIPQAKNLGGVTNQLSGPWVTSTVAGPFWADGGVLLVAFGMMAVGVAATATYTYARRRPSLASCAVGGYFLFLAVFGFYQNLWTQHVDWLLVTPLIFVVGLIADERIVLRRWRPRFERSERRPRAAAGATRLSLIVAVAGVLGLFAVAFEAQRGEWFDASLPRERRPGPVALPVETTVVQRFLSADDAVAGHGDGGADTIDLWAVVRNGELAEISGRGVSDHALNRATPTAKLALPTGSTLDVAQWGQTDQTTLFVVWETIRGFSIEVLGVRAPRTRWLRASVRDVRPLSVVRRDFAVTTWSGQQPDLFVIDRAAKGGSVAVYSGESGFRRRLFRHPLPSYRFDPDEWFVDVARISGFRPDLVFFGHGSRTGSGASEVHILAGEERFQYFSLQAPVRLRVGLGAGFRFTVRGGKNATLFVVEVRQRKDQRIWAILL